MQGNINKTVHRLITANVSKFHTQINELLFKNPVFIQIQHVKTKALNANFIVTYCKIEHLKCSS